jgi:hypothetical protein
MEKAAGGACPASSSSLPEICEICNVVGAVGLAGWRGESAVGVGDGQPSADGLLQSGGSGALSRQAPGDQEQKRTIVAAAGTAEWTSGQVTVDGRGLFRRKLVVQIFP